LKTFCDAFDGRSAAGKRRFLATADTTIALWKSVFGTFNILKDFLRSDGVTVPRHGSTRSLNEKILGEIAETGGRYAVLDSAPRYRLPEASVIELMRSAEGEISVCDDEPVHLLLTRDGLFEQRFPKSS
jgi:hypothetical protein